MTAMKMTEQTGAEAVEMVEVAVSVELVAEVVPTEMMAVVADIVQVAEKTVDLGSHAEICRWTDTRVSSCSIFQTGRVSVNARAEAAGSVVKMVNMLMPFTVGTTVVVWLYFSLLLLSIVVIRL